MAIGFKKFIVSDDETTDAVIDYLTDPQARGDYYSEGGQAVLRWLATDRLRRLFALTGYPIVTGRTAMRMLFEGRHPVTGQPIRRSGPNGTAVGAIDITLSPAPKSVSVLWALADRETRHEIERMVWVAADLGIVELMRKPLVRQRFGRGKDDVRHEAMPDIIGVQTLHTTARLAERGDGVPDPQLHVHSLLFGAVDAEGKLRALDSRQMLKVQREIDAYASATLAEMLRLRGFPIAREVDERGRVSWELDGIPDAVLRIASSRRMEIIEEGPGSLRERYREWCRERYGAEREPSGPAWDEFLSAHRGPKARLHGPALRRAWADQFGEAGWGIREAHEYVRDAALRARAGITPSDDNLDSIERFRTEFLDDVCREYALVPESHVDAMTFEKAKGLIDVTTALSVVGRMFSEGDLLVAPDGRVTTLAVVAEEQRARRAAQRLLDAPPGDAPSEETVRRAVEEAAQQGLPFDEHQAAAVRLATSGRRLVSITGQAGTGKGVTSGVIAPLWQQHGREVIALAVAGRTAQQAGHDARSRLAKTIDGFLYAVQHGYRQIDADTVLIVDEAAVIDHTRYASLLELAAETGATVIQIGDDRQLSPVGPGGLWTLVHAAAEARGNAAELRVVRRAKEAAEARAWTDVRHGRIVEALQHWQSQGRLKLHGSRAELQAGMVAEWWADRARGVMVVDTSNAERDVLNRLAQVRRTEAGELGPDVLTLDNGCQLRAGDQVVFRQSRELEPATGPNRVPRVENGTAATVSRVDVPGGEAELVLQEPHGERTVTVGRDVVLNLAYARHVQLAQGMTVEGAGQVGVSTATDRERFYVMVSRARAGAVIHAVRSEIAALAAPGLGPVTEAQQAELRRLGVGDVPDEWTWADASLEIDARRASPLGEWAMDHLTGTMGVDPVLAAHLVAQVIGRRQAEAEEPVDLSQVAEAVTAVIPKAPAESRQSAWDEFLAELQAQREALEARAGLTRVVSREGRKEAVGDLPVVPDRLHDEARQSRGGAVLADRDSSRPADIDHALGRAWRSPEPLLQLPAPEREPDLISIRLDDGVELTRGQVIRFGHPDWLAGAARREVQAGDLGIVLGCHRGGVTWDYATVELAGGRRVEVWQTAQGITVEHDLDPSVVRDATPRPDQRDPAGLDVLEMNNGARVMAGDTVRFTEATTLHPAGQIEAGAEAMVEDVQRHRYNRAVVELDDGRRAHVHPLVELKIVRPAQAPAPASPAGEGGPAAPDRTARPLPARSPLEHVARWAMRDELPRALAMYEVLGQLHVSAAPEEQLAKLWLADTEAAIVVQTWEQAAAVRRAIARESAAGSVEGGEEASPAPAVLLAEAAYQSRRTEPPLVVERAYVLADLEDREALTTALSIAMESHLVTAPPDELTADLQAAHVRNISASLEAAHAEVADLVVANRGASASLALDLAQREAEGQPAPEADREGARR